MDITLTLIVLNSLILSGFIFLVISGKCSRADNEGLDGLYLKIREDIKFAFEPMGDVPVGVEEIVDLAFEIWKIEQRVLKVSDELSDMNKKGLASSLGRIKDYLNRYDIEVKDYVGQKYNEGLNFDVLSRVQDASLEFPVVKETVEPTIIHKGRIVKRAKVILASNQI